VRSVRGTAVVRSTGIRLDTAGSKFGFYRPGQNV